MVSPSKPGTVFVVPLVARSEKDEPKVDGALSVYRSTDGGDHWDRLEEGLPERINATVHREAMRIDTLDEERSVVFVVADVRMPEIDGFDFVRVVRHRFPALPIALMSAYPTEEDEIPPGVPLLVKPFEIEALIALPPRPPGSGTA